MGVLLVVGRDDGIDCLYPAAGGITTKDNVRVMCNIKIIK